MKLQNMIAAATPNLRNAESRQLKKLLTEYGDIFAMKSNNYRWTNTMNHCTDRGVAQPILQPLRRTPLTKQAHVCEMHKAMQECEVIEETAAGNHPLFLSGRSGACASA
jgi:hypothetical protein